MDANSGQGSFTFGGGPRDPQDPGLLAIFRMQVEAEYGGESKICNKFLLFHRANPHVYPIVERIAVNALHQGRKHYGCKAIFERIRWHTDTQTEDPTGLKLQNNYTPYYARLVALVRPDLAHLFRFKPLGPKREPQILG